MSLSSCRGALAGSRSSLQRRVLSSTCLTATTAAALSTPIRRAFAATPSSSSSAAPKAKSPPTFHYQDLFAAGPHKTSIPFKKLTSDYVRVVPGPGGREILEVDPKALTLLANQAMIDIAHLLRPAHLQSLSNILKDPEASSNDRFVALELLKNANIASGMVLPGCQDTGTAIVQGKKGQFVWTTGGVNSEPHGKQLSDEEALSKGVFNAYTQKNLRYSQVAPQDMFNEKNTGSNLPAQVELYTNGTGPASNEYNFLFIAKGGGSANKTFLFQQTKALLNENSLTDFLKDKLRHLGTSACPPYHLAIVIGGLSAEQNLKTVKLASVKYLDDLPNEGNAHGQAFRDHAWERRVQQICYAMGIGAQFGGKYFVHDVRVIRLPRHGASCPVGIGVSCSADRQAVGKITKEGVFLEQLETDVSKYLPEVTEENLAANKKGANAHANEEVVSVNLDQSMDAIRAQLSAYPIKTRLSLTGTLVVARDIAHAKLQERLDRGEGLPQYIKDHIIYYAGPAKTPEGYASGSFGPTTAGRMDSYVGKFMEHGGSMITLAKGNRSRVVSRACKQYKGFYLGSIGGPAAILAQNNIKSVEVLEYPELGMEAIWKIRVENFPAFIVCDDKGNDFFERWQV